MSESGQVPESASDRVREVLENVSEALGLDAEVRVEENDEGIRGVLDGEDLGLFIGRHGQTIDAVQHLAFKIANREGPRGATRVVVDAAGYRGTPRAGCCSARPTRPRSMPSAAVGLSRSTR